MLICAISQRKKNIQTKKSKKTKTKKKQKKGRVPHLELNLVTILTKMDNISRL